MKFIAPTFYNAKGEERIYDHVVCIAAPGGKLAVESTSLNRCVKESIKPGIDFASDMAARDWLLQQPNCSVMGLSFGNVQAITTAARTHGLDREILCPRSVNGAWTARIGTEGGNIAGFCKEIGIVPLEKSSIDSSYAEQDIMFREYGVTLFQY